MVTRSAEPGLAARYAERLLAELGVEPSRPLAGVDEHPALGWARSGLMALTGSADGPPQLCPVPLTACADGALAALASLAPAAAFDGLRGSDLLAERAAIAGYTRQGAIAAGGMCRLLATADGAIAVNLARDDDWSLLPAWLEADVEADWASVATGLRARTMHDWVERGRLLGLAVAPVVPPLSKPLPWFRTCENSLPRLRGRAGVRVGERKCQLAVHPPLPDAGRADKASRR